MLHATERGVRWAPAAGLDAASAVRFRAHGTLLALMTHALAEFLVLMFADLLAALLDYASHKDLLYQDLNVSLRQDTFRDGVVDFA